MTDTPLYKTIKPLTSEELDEVWSMYVTITAVNAYDFDQMLNDEESKKMYLKGYKTAMNRARHMIRRKELGID